MSSKIFTFPEKQIVISELPLTAEQLTAFQAEQAAIQEKIRSILIGRGLTAAEAAFSVLSLFWAMSPKDDATLQNLCGGLGAYMLPSAVQGYRNRINKLPHCPECSFGEAARQDGHKAGTFEHPRSEVKQV